MTILTLKTTKRLSVSGKTVSCNVSWEPANPELARTVSHGVDFVVGGKKGFKSVEDGEAAHLPEAQAAIMAVVEELYPGLYELGA